MFVSLFILGKLCDRTLTGLLRTKNPGITKGFFFCREFHYANQKILLTALLIKQPNTVHTHTHNSLINFVYSHVLKVFFLKCRPVRAPKVVAAVT